ncbi:MAG: 2-dehydro-3-deoxygalactonokinase [Bacteroidota bacterium]|nr:2-dehydro-3-deoxygalactonokinase [Bacteroidota bacterium]
MDKFISCDWGTSSFRLRLVETEAQNVLAEVTSQQGIASTHTSWKNSSLDRFLFYRSIISAGIKTLSTHSGYSLDNVVVIISGMASSGIGMMELEYKPLPAKTGGDDLLVHPIDPSNDFKHRVIMISGVKSANDVMRGEETMVVGCDVKNSPDERLFILPGTHSKHVSVKSGLIAGCKTFMTGELFDLLSTKSILSASLEKENYLSEITNPNFEKGVKEGAYDNLLNSIFHVRTNQLFNKLNPKENYHYLSGLLIGTELKDLLHINYSSVTLVSDKKFLLPYSQALHLLEISKSIQHINADKALIKGQTVIYKLYQ